MTNSPKLPGTAKNLKLGFITGRFQLFHNGHLEYALQAKEKVDFLIVGICNPDINTARSNPADPFRHQPEHNPFTYWERLLMIKRSLLQAGLEDAEFETAPCPINKPELISNYIPRQALHFTRIYDQWGYEKMRNLEEAGYKNVILYEAPSADKTRTTQLAIGGGPKQAFAIEEGKNVRRRIVENNQWRKFVPQGTAQVIEELGLISRLLDRPPPDGSPTTD